MAGGEGCGVRRVELATGEVDGSGNPAYRIGHDSLSGEGDAVLDESRYQVVWNRVNSDGPLHRDIWNSIRAPEAR